MVNLVDDWETGDDELLDIVDDTLVPDGEEDGPEDVLDTCPVCGAIFLDFCLSVSAILHHCLWSGFMSHLAITSTRECLC